MTENFREDVRSTLRFEYEVNGKVVKGNAISAVLSEMKGWRKIPNLKSRRIWRNLGTLGNFEDELKKAGFKVERGFGRRPYDKENKFSRPVIVVYES